VEPAGNPVSRAAQRTGEQLFRVNPTTRKVARLSRNDRSIVQRPTSLPIIARGVDLQQAHQFAEVCEEW